MTLISTFPLLEHRAPQNMLQGVSKLPIPSLFTSNILTSGLMNENQLHFEQNFKDDIFAFT